MTDASPSTRRQSVPPLVLALLGIMVGCVMDAMIKHLGVAYSAVLIATARYGFGTVFSGAAVFALRKKLPDGAGLRRHAIRAVASTGSAVLFFYSLSVLPIAEATVLIFGAPLMIPPLARWLLGEKVRRMAIVAIAVGFIGVLATVQGTPFVSEDANRMTGVLAGISAAFLYALSVVLLRQLAQRDDAVVTSFLGNLFPAAYLLIPALVLGAAPAPADLPTFAFIGLAGFILWLMLTHAYARAPAQRLAPAEFTALIWSALLGYLFFAEIPRVPVWIGAVIIAIAVTLSAWDGRRAAAIPPVGPPA